ncbi:MAG TPA: hypothetical protein DCY88_10565 [Cyanobacteria bacterium UBA11372]|nr:hypothetical protein [Cyanobacteria bacterium UBA11372]
MSKQEKMTEKWGKLIGIINDVPKKLAKAVEEEISTFDSLNCLQQGTLNFALIEDDIKHIHEQLEVDGAVVLGSHLILDDEKNLMEIKTYTRSGGKNYVSTVSSEFKRAKNIPADIVAELKKKGRIELHLKLDD